MIVSGLFLFIFCDSMVKKRMFKVQIPCFFKKTKNRLTKASQYGILFKSVNTTQ